VNLLFVPENRSTVPSSFIPCPYLCIDRAMISPWLEFCPFLYTGMNIGSLTLKLQMCYRLLLLLCFVVVVVVVGAVVVVEVATSVVCCVGRTYYLSTQSTYIKLFDMPFCIIFVFLDL